MTCFLDEVTEFWEGPLRLGHVARTVSGSKNRSSGCECMVGLYACDLKKLSESLSGNIFPFLQVNLTEPKLTRARSLPDLIERESSYSTEDAPFPLPLEM